MLNLVPAIKQLEEQVRQMEADFNKQVRPYKDSIGALRRINETCETCNGKGKILRPRICAEDDRPDPNNPRDWLVCPACGGSGKANK